jgi:hypothetical protein
MLPKKKGAKMALIESLKEQHAARKKKALQWKVTFHSMLPKKKGAKMALIESLKEQHAARKKKALQWKKKDAYSRLQILQLQKVLLLLLTRV